MKTKRSLLIGLLVLLLSVFAFPDSGYGQRKGPPPWAPAHGYRAKFRQIYYPQYNFYYDTYKHVYIYMGGHGWEINVSLPARYAHIDLNACRRVPLNIDSDRPYIYNHDHMVRYGGRDDDGYKSERSHGRGRNHR